MKRMEKSVWLIILLSVVLSLVACDGGDDDDDDDNDTGDDDTGDDDTAGDDDTGDDDTGDDDDDFAGPGTRHPIILVHGFAGWGYLENAAYFYQVRDHLMAAGYDVYEPNVAAVGTIAQRAGQLAELIEEQYPGQRVNVIAHSQGGLDIRYMITTMGWGDRVASLTTISTPHKGTAIADVVAGLLPDFSEAIIDWILELLGLDWDVVSELTRENITENFNPQTPDWPGVKYYSYFGDAAEYRWSVMNITYNILLDLEGRNDGIIGCESAIWGEFLGEISTDHAGEIGHPLGNTNWDWLTFYENHCIFLRDEGF